MGALSSMVFKPIITKEFEIQGKKVIMKALTTKDNISMEFNLEDLTKDAAGIRDILKSGVEILSRSIQSVDGIAPENVKECSDFLLAQDSTVVVELLNKYQSMFEEAKVELGK